MSDNKTLGVHQKVGPFGAGMPKEIESNNRKVCLDCGVKIIRANDSGWEGFTADGVTTQPLCIVCDLKRSSITEKADDSPPVLL